MGLFDFVSGWKAKLIDQPLDAKMTETLKIGLAIARNEVHVITGNLQRSIGGEYDRRTKTIMLHADQPYALIEETRAPLGQHSYLAPAANEMAHYWGAPNFELHYPNALLGKAAARSRNPMAAIRQQETRLISGFSSGRGGVARRVRVYSRRWHKRAGLIPSDPLTPLV